MSSPPLPDFRTFLSTAILSDQQNISYRSLSRALKCHVNTAKCLLYEYYEEQNKRKAGSVYATYMIAGVRKAAGPSVVVETNGHSSSSSRVNGQKKNGEGEDEGAAASNSGDNPDHDDIMDLPSSLPPFSSSMLDPSQSSQDTATGARPLPPPAAAAAAPVKTVMLVRQEDLEGAKSQYEEISGIHIYSLSPGKIADLVALTDIGRGLFADVFSKEDPLLHNKTYGVIQNQNVRRRKRRPNNIGLQSAVSDKPKMQPVKKEAEKEKTRPGAAAAAAAAAATAAAPRPNTLQAAFSKPTTTATSSLKREETTSRPSSRDSTSIREDVKKPVKRDIFSAFAKAASSSKAKPAPKEESQDTTMTDADFGDDDDMEGESEEEALFLDTNTRKSGTKRESDVRKEREDKAAKLRKMMDSDDDDDDDDGNDDDDDDGGNVITKDAAAAAIEGEGEEEPEDDDAVAWSESDADADADDDKQKQKQKKQQPQQQQQQEVGPRRKRGKRKVLKKEDIEDEEGFIVTKEYEVWEYFSETDNDDEEPKKAATAPAAALPKKSLAASSSASAGTGTSTSNNKAKAKEKGGENNSGKAGGKAAAAAAESKKIESKKIKGDIRGFFRKK